MIPFWVLAKASRPDEGGYFDATLERALELECSLPFNSVAWVKSQWPGIEFYLYDTGDSPSDRVQRVRSTLGVTVTSVRRPTDHGQDMDVDWIVHVVDDRRETT